MTVSQSLNSPLSAWHEQAQEEGVKEHQHEANEVNIFTQCQAWFCSVSLRLLHPILSPISCLFKILSPSTFTCAAVCIIMLLSFIIYQITSSLSSYFFSSIDIPNPISLLAGSLTSFATPVVYFYCVTLHGPFCTPVDHDKMNPDQISQIARTVSGTAQKASDIFDSVIQLSDPRNLGSNQSEILELSFKIRWSSELNNKDLLSDELVELGDITCELNDKLVGLNSQGLNTFSFISYEVRNILFFFFFLPLRHLCEDLKLTVHQTLI